MNYIVIMKVKDRKDRFILLKLVKRFAPKKKLKELLRKQLKSIINSNELGIKKRILKLMEKKISNICKNSFKKP